jgi:hypothetical protein
LEAIADAVLYDETNDGVYCFTFILKNYEPRVVWFRKLVRLLGYSILSEVPIYSGVEIRTTIPTREYHNKK